MLGAIWAVCTMLFVSVLQQPVVVKHDDLLDGELRLACSVVGLHT